MNIYNRATRRLEAVLDNAKNIREDIKLNAVSEMRFSLPVDDDKNKKCEAFKFVRWGDDGDLYRLLDTSRRESRNAETNLLSYEAEHVIATLIDDVIFQFWRLDNLATRQVIELILARQTVTNWILGDCEFTRRFSYSWTSENLLTALFSVPNRFDVGYRWEFDTNVYPWIVHLRLLDETIRPQYYIRGGKNLMSLSKRQKGRDIVTRLYPLGYGEGDNQLTIRDVNGGVPYIDAPPEVIAKYGLITRIWEDLRFEDAQSLLDRGRVLIDKLSKPYESWSVQTADIYKLTGEEYDRAYPGKIVRWDDLTTYIISARIHRDAVGLDQIELANEPEDIASSIAELADRQRINSLYAQGNTVMYSQSLAENASGSYPLVFDFYIPSEARIINKAIITWRLQRFRADVRAAASGGGSSQTSSSGGGSSQTSSSGGGSSQTSSSGGGSSQTSSAGGGVSTSTESGGGVAKSTDSGGFSQKTESSKTSGGSSKETSDNSTDINDLTLTPTEITYINVNTQFTEATNLPRHAHTFPTNQVIGSHRHRLNLPKHSHGMAHTHTVPGFTIEFPAHRHEFSVPAHTHSFSIGTHTHGITIPAHTHGITIPAHTHGITIPAHTHGVTIPAHTHGVTIPAHTHPMEYGIYEGTSGARVTLRVDGTQVLTLTYLTEFDVVKYLSVDGGGKIRRGVFHRVEIVPDALTRISAAMYLQLFIQSESDVTL